jgi:hypothetical protein
MFDPKPHLIQLPRRVKGPDGRSTTVYDDYLEVEWRLVWFREKYPHGAISTQEICVDLEHGYARFRALVSDGEGGTATGYGTETAAGFADYVERAETRALGRALAALGVGTQFVGQDLTRGRCPGGDRRGVIWPWHGRPRRVDDSRPPTRGPDFP